MLNFYLTLWEHHNRKRLGCWRRARRWNPPSGRKKCRRGTCRCWRWPPPPASAPGRSPQSRQERQSALSIELQVCFVITELRGFNCLLFIGDDGQKRFSFYSRTSDIRTMYKNTYNSITADRARDMWQPVRPAPCAASGPASRSRTLSWPADQPAPLTVAP